MAAIAKTAPKPNAIAIRSRPMTRSTLRSASPNSALVRSSMRTQAIPFRRLGEINLTRHAEVINLMPKYSPDLNPIEQIFAKLKHLLRKAAARTIEAVCAAIGELLGAFTATECANY